MKIPVLIKKGCGILPYEINIPALPRLLKLQGKLGEPVRSDYPCRAL